MKFWKAIILLLIVSFAGCKEKGEICVGKRGTPKEEKPIVVLTMSYNNVEYVERNARSVLDQNYRNFRWIYVDDCSSDGTAEKVKTIAGERVEVIRNTVNRGAMANMYDAIHAMRPEEIVVVLDGDDWFSHENVLMHVNEYYADEDTWITYGHHIEFPSFTQGLCKGISRKMLRPGGFRKSHFYFAHLRTFYAGLFQKIKREDFEKDGAFYPMAADMASMIPMLEMAGKKHIRYVRELLYVYNMGNPIADAKRNVDLQQAIDRHIRSLTPYKELESL